MGDLVKLPEKLSLVFGLTIGRIVKNGKLEKSEGSRRARFSDWGASLKFSSDFETRIKISWKQMLVLEMRNEAQDLMYTLENHNKASLKAYDDGLNFL